MLRTRFKIEITYEMRDGFLDTENFNECSDCDVEPDERTPDTCKEYISKMLATPALYVEERILDASYHRRIKITPIPEDIWCQYILEDGSICNNGKVFTTCLVCDKPYCHEHIGDTNVCGSQKCQNKINTIKNKIK